MVSPRLTVWTVRSPSLSIADSEFCVFCAAGEEGSVRRETGFGLCGWACVPDGAETELCLSAVTAGSFFGAAAGSVRGGFDVSPFFGGAAPCSALLCRASLFSPVIVGDEAGGFFFLAICAGGFGGAEAGSTGFRICCAVHLLMTNNGGEPATCTKYFAESGVEG